LRTPEDDAAIEAAESALSGYLADLLGQRRQAPGDDLLSDLLAVQDGGDRISRAEVVSLAMLPLVAGHETTVNLIGNGTLALLRAPDQLDILLRSPDLIPGAVDELLRFDSPVQISQRIVLQDMELADRRVRTGAGDLASDDDLSRWVDIGIGYARSLPPKRPALPRDDHDLQNG
jgi:cytochrome P450